MKVQIKSFWEKPQLILGNSFSKNGKEVKRRLQMSLKKKSPQLKMIYGFLGFVLCVFLASAFKTNTKIVPSLFKEKLISPEDKLIPAGKRNIRSIKVVNTEEKLDSNSYIILKDAHNHTLSPKAIIAEAPIWLDIKHPKSEKVKIVKVAVQFLQEEGEALDKEIQYFLGNKIDWERFDISSSGNVLIQVTEVLINNEIINVEKQAQYKASLWLKPISKVKSITSEPYKQNKTAFLRMANLPLYKNFEHSLFIEFDKVYRQEDLSYMVDNGTIRRGKERGEILMIPAHAGTSNLQVYYQGEIIKKHNFKVREVPSPIVYLADFEGRKLDTRKTLFTEKIPQIKVMLKPDETFEAIFPQESKYHITGLEITQFSGGRSIKSLTINSEKQTAFLTIDMSNFELKTGDGFNVKIMGINRVKANGQTETVAVLRPNIQFSVRVPDIEKE